MNSDNKLVNVFYSIEDPRIDINKLHNLVNFLLTGKTFMITSLH